MHSTPIRAVPLPPVGAAHDKQRQRVIDACTALATVVATAPDDLLLLMADAANLHSYGDEERAHVLHHLGCLHDHLQEIHARSN